MRNMSTSGRSLGQGQHGITGLETAIVLIAFVVVSSVFAFAALSTGLFSSDKSKETIQAGLAEAQGTLEVKGGIQLNSTLTAQTAVSGTGSPTGDGVSWTLTQTPVLPGSETLTSGDGSTILTLGSDYSITYDTGVLTTNTPLSALTATYTSYSITSTDILLSNAAGGQPVDLTPGETIVIYLDVDDTYTVTDFGLTVLGSGDSDNLLERGEIFSINVDVNTGDLTDGDTFTVQLKPPSGAVLNLNRTVPAKIETVMNLAARPRII